MLDNSLNYFSEQADLFLQDVWGDREMGIPTPAINWTKPPTRQQVAALLRNYPYIQIVSSEMQHRDQIIPRFITASTGWVIHDYDQAMSVSLGRYLYRSTGSAAPIEDEEGGGEGEVPPGRGSLIQQVFDTADEMVSLAIEKGWPGVQVVSGTESMTWSLWMAAEDRGYTMVGYNPSAEDKRKRELILKYRSERGMGRTPSVTPTNV